MWLLSGVLYTAAILIAFGSILSAFANGFLIAIIVAIMGRLCSLVNHYNKYNEETEMNHHRRIPIVTMNFKEFKSYFNLFPNSFTYETFDDSFYFTESERNIEKMFYYNDLTNSLNRINFTSFLDWVKFYYWNRHRLRVKKHNDELERAKANEREYNRIAKRNKEDDRQATELVYQDLLNKVEKEVKLANQEIKQGLDTMKQITSGGFNG